MAVCLKNVQVVIESGFHSLESLKRLLKTPAIRGHVERQETRIEELIGDFSN